LSAFLCQLFFNISKFKKHKQEIFILYCQYIFAEKPIAKVMPLEICRHRHVLALLVPTASPADMAEHTHNVQHAVHLVKTFQRKAETLNLS